MLKNNMGKLYDILNVPQNATPEELKKAFHKLAVSHHPDKTNGDKAKEDEFKSISEAYTILSDPEKRKNYDQFGDEGVNSGGGPGVDAMADIFKNMFGGFGGGFGGGGFGGFGGFGGGGETKVDLIEVPIDINDIYYGQTKRIEFEINDICDKCNGTGAQDPSFVINCSSCGGNGSVVQQLGPFMVKSTCPQCNGKGQTIKNQCFCIKCKGSKTVYVKKKFDLKLHNGVIDGHNIVMHGRGSYDAENNKNRDICFRFKYDIKEPYTILQNDVHYKCQLTIEELLAGFVKDIEVYKTKICLKSDRYFNPEKAFVIKGLGLSHKKGTGNLIIDFEIKWTDSARLEKYKDVLTKIIRPNTDTISQCESIYDVNESCSIQSQ